MSSGKAASGVGGLISKVIRKPWQYTGPTSSPEYLESLVKAGEYRPVAPTNVPAPIVPSAEDDRIYDIKYFNRDGRRADLAPRTENVSLSALAADAAAQDIPASAGAFYFYGREFPLDDTPGDGYQKCPGTGAVFGGR